MEPVEVAIGELVELGSVLVMVQRRPAAVASVPGARRDGRDANAVHAAASEAMHGPAAEASDDVRVPRGALPSDHPAIERIAAGTISVLILGETGVGKEILAERIHRSSPRAGRPLIRFNCAALSEGLLESELFAHERGAFTAATNAKLGPIEAAGGSSLDWHYVPDHAALVLFGAPPSLCSALHGLDSGLAAGWRCNRRQLRLPQVMTRSVNETNS